jgi:predicted phage terminase large subunit-like protein
VVRVDRERLRRQRISLLLSVVVESFADFVRYGWNEVEPTRALAKSHAIDGMCAAAQAVGEKRIQRLIVETCPGTAKSVIWCVMFPAWLLLRSRGQARVMAGSYSYTFATRDGDRCRQFVKSDWYQELVLEQARQLTEQARKKRPNAPEVEPWEIREDADRKDDWSTSTTGRRLIASPGGKSTGERCTTQIIDDSIQAMDAYNKNAKDEATRWIDEALSNRLEDKRVDQRVLVAQRLAKDDPSGRQKERVGLGWRCLTLPIVLTAEDVPCELRDDRGELVWRDPRAVGEPISEFFPPEVQAATELEVGPTAYDAQYRQKPRDESQSMFPSACFQRRWEVEPETFDRMVIALDASFKEGNASDYAVIQAWGAKGGDRYLLEQWRKQAGFSATLDALLEMAQRYPFAKVLIEAAANGHAIFDAFRKKLPGAVDIPPAGGKFARASSIEGVVVSGAVILPAHAIWVPAWLSEVTAFSGKRTIPHDDQVDAMAYALRELQSTSKKLPSVSGAIIQGVRR